MSAPSIQSTVVPVDPRIDHRWDELTAAGGSVFTSPPWIRAVCDQYGFEPQARIMEDGDGIPHSGFTWVGLNDIRGERLVSLPFTDRAEPIASGLAEWASLAEDALAEGIPLTVRCLDGAAPSSDNRFERIGEATWHGTRVDTPLAELQRSLHPSARRDIATAARRGITVHDCTGIDAVRTFHGIHVLLRKRKYQLLAQPLEFFERIWHEFSRFDGIVTLLAYAGDEPVAGGVFLEWGDTLYSKFIASRAEALALRPNHAVYWRAIEWAAERGLRLVDWGLSDLDQPGLVDYKRKWAADEGRILTLRTPGQCPGHGSESGPLLANLTRLLTNETVPDEVTKQAGALLYRYFT
jgi:hypothetical protein